MKRIYCLYALLVESVTALLLKVASLALFPENKALKTVADVAAIISYVGMIIDFSVCIYRFIQKKTQEPAEEN